jgi:hypothetical protein
MSDETRTCGTCHQSFTWTEREARPGRPPEA